MLKRSCCPGPIEMVRIKSLNNLVEQGHRFIQCRGEPVRGLKSFILAASTIAGIGLVDVIRMEQFRPELRLFQKFCSGCPEGKGKGRQFVLFARCATQSSLTPEAPIP